MVNDLAQLIKGEGLPEKYVSFSYFVETRPTTRTRGSTYGRCILQGPASGDKKQSRNKAGRLRFVGEVFVGFYYRIIIILAVLTKFAAW